MKPLSHSIKIIFENETVDISYANGIVQIDDCNISVNNLRTKNPFKNHVNKKGVEIINLLALKLSNNDLNVNINIDIQRNFVNIDNIKYGMETNFNNIIR